MKLQRRNLVISVSDFNMSKTVILDSYPTASIHFPSHVPLNTLPPLFPQKHKGQPLLGQHQAKYTHFIPMKDESSHVKDLLEVQDTETAEPQPIQGYQELLKAEKILTGEAKPSTSDSSSIVDSSFKNEAKEYLQSPNTYSEDSYQGKQQPEDTTEKNDSQVASIIAAAAKPRAARPRKSHKSKPPKKKSKPRNQKLKNFHIVQKKKKWSYECKTKK